MNKHLGFVLFPFLFSIDSPFHHSNIPLFQEESETHKQKMIIISIPCRNSETFNRTSTSDAP
jgi:hypothetical protein